MYTIEYYSAVKENEIMLFAGKWMELEIIMLSEISQAQKEKGHIKKTNITFSLDLKKKDMNIKEGVFERTSGRGKGDEGE
jgi:hypothetical protein